MKNGPLKFCLKLSLIALPVVLYFGFPYAVLILSGESTPLASVVRRQAVNETQILYGPAYSNQSSAYKLEIAKRRKAKVLALGTSRVLQFRSAFFRDQDSFYNAGHGVKGISEYAWFLEQLPEEGKPEVILLGVDQWNFYQEFRLRTPSSDPVELSAHSTTEKMLQNFSARIHADYWEGKFSLSSLMRNEDQLNGDERTRVGLLACSQGSGYRNDGSYRYGKLSVDYRQGFRPSIERVHRRDYLFTGTLVKERTEVLSQFLAGCRDAGQHVVVFLPPYTAAVYSAIQETGGGADALTQLPKILTQVAASHGYPFYDFSDMSVVGPDKEAIDGTHGSDVTYLRMLALMASKDPQLKRHVIDVDALNSQLARRLRPNALNRY